MHVSGALFLAALWSFGFTYWTLAIAFSFGTSPFGLYQSALFCIDMFTQVDCFSEFFSVASSRMTLHLSSHLPNRPYRDMSIFTLMRMPPPSAPCAFSMSSIICLSLFIPQSTVRRLEGLGLSFSLSQFTFQICLFTPRATLPHLKRYLSSAECFRAVPHVNTRLFPPSPL